jgi:molybdopterin biosynthesis enzyme MoaB
LSKKTFTLETVVTSLEKSLVLQEAINVENDNKLKNYMINIESYTIIIDEKNKTIEDNIKAAKKEKRKAILTSGIVGIIGGLVLSIFI